MPINLIACIYALIAISGGYAVCLYVFKSRLPDLKLIYISWVTLTVLVFIIPNPGLYFFLCLIALLFLSPKDSDKKLILFFALLPAIPLTILWRISVPGIETLLWMNHVRILTICLLLPIIFQSRQTASNSNVTRLSYKNKNLFGLIYLYLLLSIILDWRIGNITSSVRMSIEVFLNTIIIIMAIKTACHDRKTINQLLLAMLVSGVFVACISMVEQVKNWKLYNEVNGNLVYWKVTALYLHDVRGGFLRTPATMAPIPLGYYMGLCTIISLYFIGLRKLKPSQFAGSHHITAIVLIALFFSGSRAAWLTTVLMIGLLLFFNARFKSMRGLLICLGFLTTFSASAIIEHFAQSDPYGTLQYRIDLFNNSLLAIKDNLLFGSPRFLSHPALQPMMQGEQIIDIVNSYLGIALQYGLIGLTIIIILLYKLCRALWSQRSLAEKQQDNIAEWQSRIILVLIMGTAYIISTTSMIDRISHYLWMLLSLGICLMTINTQKSTGQAN